MTTASEQVVQQPTQSVAKPAADLFRFGWRYVWKKDDRGQLQHVQTPLTFEDVLHPQEEDFIVHHTAHEVDCPYLRHAMKCALNGRADVRVLFDVRIDWGVEGIEPHGPDIVVFFDVQRSEEHPVGTWKPKDYGARPALVIEVTSPTTRGHDLNSKVMEYFQAGIPFYAVVDYLPEVDLTQAVLLGFRATPQGYVRVPLDERGRLWLEPVGVWLAWEGGRAVCYDAENNRILDGEEYKRQLQHVESRNEELQTLAEEAITARQEAEKQAKEEARQREEAEKQAKEEARQREEAEKRASDLVSRMADMEAELRRLRGGG